jgi:membrane associated rhomboid family serine protease
MTATIGYTNKTPERETIIQKEGGEPHLVAIAGPEADRIESLSLVLSAVGIEHVLDERDKKLLVADQDAESALFHLNEYRTENLNWPPLPPPRPTLHPQTPPTLLMMGLLTLFFAHTGSWSTDSRWFTQGAIDSVAILDRGEWWRLLTALTLHADLVHLTGNCLIGGVMIHFLSKTVGYGWAWLLLLLNGFAGNLLNILLRQDPHISVGFSTSVFAAIGIFTGLQFIRLKERPIKELMLPLGAGAGLLAFLGSEGVRTDLGAHFFGFVCGIASGILLGRTGVLATNLRPSFQPLLFSVSLSSILLCWMLALR